MIHPDPGSVVRDGADGLTDVMPRIDPAYDPEPERRTEDPSPDPARRPGDETMIIPRIRDAHPSERLPAIPAWDRDGARGVAPVEASPFGQGRALASLAWIFPTVVMAIVGTVRLNWAGLDRSELYRWGFTTTSWHDAFALIRSIPAGDVPYDLFIHAWAQGLGRSDYALRLPSVIAMAFAAGLLARIVTRLGSPRIGAVAALTMIAIPSASRYAQNVGPQAFVVLTCMLATLALIRLLDRPTTGRYALYGLTILAVGASSVAGLTIVVAHLLIVALMRRTALFGWAVAAIVGAVPSVALAVYATAPLAGAPTKISFTDVVAATFGALLVGGAVLALGVIGVSFRRPAVVFAMWAIVPMVLYYPVARYTALDPSVVVSVAFAAWASLAAFGLSRAPVVRGVLAVALVVGLGMATQTRLRQFDGHGQATRTLAATLSLQQHAGDVIVYGPPAGDGQFGRDLVARYVPADSQPTDALLVTPARRNGHPLPTLCADVNKCLNSAARVWVIRADSLNDPLNGMDAATDGALRVGYTVAQTWQFTGLTLSLFVLSPSSGS